MKKQKKKNLLNVRLEDAEKSAWRESWCRRIEKIVTKESIKSCLGNSNISMSYVLCSKIMGIFFI